MTDRIEVEEPVAAVYRRWAHVEDFPQFMVQVDCLEVIDEVRLHLTTTVEGLTTEWDAEIVELRPNESLAWRATDGSNNGGRVEFRPRGDSRTEVAFFLAIDDERFTHRRAAAEHLSHLIALEDLARFRALVEADRAGSVPCRPGS